MHKTSTFSHSLILANSLWIPAGVFYYLGHVAFTGSLNVPLPLSHILDNALEITTRIIFLTWLWGLIVEICSGEDSAPRFANFKANLKQGWWVAGLAFLMPWLLHFALFMITEKNIITINGLTSILHVVLAYWAAGQFIKIKYRHLFSAARTNWTDSLGTTLTGLIFLTLALTLYYSLSLPGLHPALKPILEVLDIQLYFFMFTFFATVELRNHPEITQHFAASRTLILINLPSGDIMFQVFSALAIRLYPTFFAVLRALTPPGYRIIEYNRLIWNDRFYQGNALVAISCFTSNCSDAYRIAQEYRRRGCKVVMGGPHVTFFAAEALEFCDSVVIGPAESVWETIVSDYEKGSLQPLYHGSCPASKLKQVHNYLLNAPVEIAANCLQASRGCKFDCYFCANPAITGSLNMEKSIEDMIALVKKVSRQKKLLFFLDNNIYADPTYAKKFMQELIPLKIKWTAHASIDVAKDDEALRLMQRSGCVALLIGYEVDASSSEGEHGGKLALARDYLQLTRKIQKAGIQVKAHFMLGFPGDSWSGLARLWWFCFRLSPEFTVLSFMTPLPGSRFFKDVVRNGTVLNSNWRAYDIYHQVIDHPRLGNVWLFRKSFAVVTTFFLLTTSSFGRILLLAGILLELSYLHALG